MSSPSSDEWITTSTVLQRLTDFTDRSAWERLTERFSRPVQAFAKKQGLAESECEDVAQETLLAFAEAYRRGEYDPDKGRLSSWIFGIAWRRIDHARRKRKQRDEHEEGGFESRLHPGVDGPPAQSAEWQELWERSILEHCLRQVRKEFEPATFRAFEMLVLEHHSIEAAEKELAMTRNALSIAKHRVSTRLRELVRECDEVRP
ncbi:MAG: RNA polymerase sigma factor [Planctomycetes bacterium]|nr:RNA polymerase sigma factor [Planctomycetota bacterium]